MATPATSDESRVMADVSMATSVPVPMAMPRSARARAGASLTPSPTMATTRPSAWRRAISSALAAGSTPAITRVTPSSVAMAAAVRALSPVTMATSTPMRGEVGDRGPGAGTDGVGQGEEAPGLAVPPDEHDGAARLLRARRPPPPIRAPAAMKTSVADDHGDAVDLGPHPVTGDGLERRGGGDVEPSAAGAGHDRPADGVLGADLGRRRPGQHLVAVHTLPGDHVGERHLPHREGARLVEHDGVDALGPLEDLAPLDEHAQAGAPAGADHDRHRRGQAEGARAGDDEHGDGGEEAVDRTIGRERPGQERDRGHGQDDGHEHARHPVGQPLHRRLRPLGLGHQARRSGPGRCRPRPRWPAP